MFKIMKKENLKEIQEFPEFEEKKKKRRKKYMTIHLLVVMAMILS